MKKSVLETAKLCNPLLWNCIYDRKNQIVMLRRKTAQYSLNQIKLLTVTMKILVDISDVVG